MLKVVSHFLIYALQGFQIEESLKSPSSDFDLVVIGTGARAVPVATVAIVDVRPFGGPCVLRGCDPKIDRRGDARVVQAITDCPPQTFDADVVVHGAVRVPFV